MIRKRNNNYSQNQGQNQNSGKGRHRSNNKHSNNRNSGGPQDVGRRKKALASSREKYLNMARDAVHAGDRVQAENCYQHADHYLRVLESLEPQENNGNAENENEPAPSPKPRRKNTRSKTPEKDTQQSDDAEKGAADSKDSDD